MDRVLDAMRPHLESLARMYADPRRPSESSSDLLQESCVRAWRKIDTFEGGKNDEQTFSMFRAWMGQIVRRLGMNARRDGAAAGRIPPEKIRRIGTAPGQSTGGGGALPAATRTPSAHAREGELTAIIEKALDDLPDPVSADIVRMRYFDRLTIPEIAERLDSTPVRVRERYRSALRRLRRSLGKWL